MGAILFIVTSYAEKRQGTDEAMMSCKQWLLLKRLADVSWGFIRIGWCFQPKKAKHDFTLPLTDFDLCILI